MVSSNDSTAEGGAELPSQEDSDNDVQGDDNAPLFGEGASENTSQSGVSQALPALQSDKTYDLTDVEDEQDTDPTSQIDETDDDAEEEEVTYVEYVEIASAEDLTAFAQRVNGGDSMKDVLVTLLGDIALDPDTEWAPIGYTVETPFAGTFDGGQYTISGIRVGEEVEGGLFGYLYEATIHDLYLKSVQAPNSVNGMYFFAARSTITDCKRKWGPFALFSSSISLFAVPTYTGWVGGLNTPDNTLVVTNQTVIITTPNELAYVAQLCNAGTERFLNKTVILGANLDMSGHNWTSIGSASTTSFQGRFYGQGYVIKDMTTTAVGGLFGYLSDGVVNNLVITDADVSGTTTGIVARQTNTSSISGIVVKDSYIHGAATVAGICHTVQGNSTAPASITQCVVMNTTIQGNTGASGIVYTNGTYGITQCVVYGCDLTATNTTGIAFSTSGPSSTYSGVNQHLVLGTTFNGTSSNYGVVNTISGWNSTGNNFISDVVMPSSLNNNYLGTDKSGAYGVEYFFTDSQLPNHLVHTSALDYITNCVWDRSTTSRTALPTTGVVGSNTYSTGHAAYATSYLTAGTWRPNEVYWDAQKDYYPYLKYLLASQTPYLADITGLASVAVLLDDPEDTLDNAKEIRLMKRTASGSPLLWYSGASTRVESDNRFEVIDNGNSLTLWVQNDVTFDLRTVATIDTEKGDEELVKHFSNITLRDSILEEDVSARVPSVSDMTVPQAVTLVPSLTFDEPIRANPDARELIRLYAISSGGEYLDKALACAAPDMIVSATAPYTVTFPTLGLRDSMRYKLVIPAGAVEEIDMLNMPMGNYNEEVIFEFDTISYTVPQITADATKSILTNSSLTLSEVETWFAVSNYPDNPTKIQWTTAVTDPKVTLASLPVGIYYYVDPAVLGGNRPEGTYIVHYFAVTSHGKSARASTAITVEGLPSWDADPPIVEHINWTNNPNALTALALNEARATYTTSRGSKRSAPIDAEVDQADWNAAMANPNDPAIVKVTSYMLNQQGNRITSDPRETRIYMDKVLQYDFNTGAIRIKWEDRTLDEWKKEIEEEIAFRALNFASTANVQYDHGSNLYDEDKVYQVSLTTDQQVVTLCDGDPTSPYPCSVNNHTHLKDKVELTFSIKIVNVQIPEEIDYWNKVENEIYTSGNDLKKDYFLANYTEFNEIAQRRPELKIPDQFPNLDADNYFEMPASIIEALRVQPYNTLTLHYSRYQWKFYGHALESVGDQKIYPLKVTQENASDYAIRKTIGKNTPAVLLDFDYIGFLHGRVEFFYDLRLAGGLSKEEIAETDFYLYRYDKASGRLIPVSDVIVDEDGWASAVITQVENELYVFTDSRFGGDAYRRYVGIGAEFDDDWEDDLENEPTDDYYLGANNFGADITMFDTHRLDDTAVTSAGMGNSGAPEPGPASATAADIQPESAPEKTAAPAVAAAAALLIAGAVAMVVRYRKRKGA